MILMVTRICKKCETSYTINYGEGETDDKPCPKCSGGHKSGGRSLQSLATITL